MKHKSPDMGDLGLEELYASVQRQIRDLRVELEVFKEEARAGGEFNTSAAKETLTRLKGLVSQCSGLEKAIAESRKHQLGVERGHVLDFDAAKREVRCALDRIRTGGGSGAVS